MGENPVVEIPAGRRHIIERPRLTRLLDETSARVIMLVAPAGYGKTTLARQWLATRPHAWYQASAVSSDVAALALAVSEALDSFAPEARQLLFERIGATPDVDQELPVLAEIQTEALREWPSTAWLVIDDYQLLKASQIAESYIHLLLSSSPLRLLLTSRERPTWATARKLLYGEVYEIGRSPLAMSQDEAQSVFRASSTDGLPGLVALAEGWPAVIGLASLSQPDDLEGVVPETLYEYFADELYQAASPTLQRALPELALSPHLTLEMATSFLGPRRGPRLLEEACNVGFMTMTASRAELHPLLRTFLLRKLEDLPDAREGAVRKIAEFHLERKAWDDAFALLRECPLSDVLLTLVESALGVMLRAGRLSTLAEWLILGAELDLRSPVLELARAELAIRKGNVRDAEARALHVTKEQATAALLTSRAFCLAGRAAHLDNREDDALAHFRSARNLAESEAERRDAMWGSFLCAQAQAFESEEELRATLLEFVSQDTLSPDEMLRSANARLIVGVTIGGIPEALEEAALSARMCIPEAADPLVRTSFLNLLTRTLSLVGRYAEAIDIAEQEIEEAHRSRLAFVLPHAYVATAVAAVGLRHYGEAERALTKGRRLAEDIGDKHNLLDAQTVRSKIAIATGNFARALDLTSEATPRVQLTPLMLGEYAATRALASACDGDLAGARLASRKAEGLSGFPEVASLIACARAVISVQNRDTNDKTPLFELDPVYRLSVFDPLVIAVRGCPALIPTLTSMTAELPLQLARELTSERIDVPEPTRGVALLSPREAEVLDLLTLGYANKDIAKALYISEVTVKVHVRQILKKLGVRSRTQAALAAVRSR
ncbi:MAG TPA: LuxR C-terminal-related transcriptional regulator [Gaiellaceae bacterium]|nr:LuxR C-terminal-related transcriptional regulator [Gaiellaceae bacterium]